MKQIIRQTIHLALCLLGGMAYGQTGTLYRVPTGGTDQIVRYEPTTGKHVTYSFAPGNENHFSLTDFNTLLDVKVADGLKVKDFEIIDGLVFFCGDNGSGLGFLGWFDINNLFYSGGTAYIDQTLSAYGLLTLDNIEVFRNPSTGNIHIAGYGNRGILIPNYTQFCAFEAVGTPATGMQYRTLDLWCTLYVEVTDVAITDNFVVYLSSDKTQVNWPNRGVGITLQPFPKYDMFGAPPYFYHYYQLSYVSALYSNSWVLPINDDPCSGTEPMMVNTVNDEIAVCTYRRDYDDTPYYPLPPPPQYFPYTATYITHLMFDLSTLLPSTNNFIPMTSYYIAQLYNGDPVGIDGFEYDPQMRRYAILHRHESSPGVHEHTVTKFDLAVPPTYVESAYQTTFNTSSYWLPNSMCYDGTIYYTVVGYDMASSDYIFWRRDMGVPGGQYSNCDRTVQYPVTPLPLVPAKYYERETLPQIWKPLHFEPQESGEVEEFLCEIMCNILERKE